MSGFSRVDRVLCGWLVGVLCALLMACLALFVINRTIYDPAGQVRQYIQALQAGDGERALGISGARVPEGAGAAMLDAEALKNSMRGLEDLKVRTLELKEGGSRATVEVTYRVGQEQKSSRFHLHTVGAHWGVFDRWEMDPVELPTVKVVAPSVKAATLNGTKVRVEEGSRRFATFYPGEYELTYESALYSGGEKRALVGAAGEQPVLDLGLAPSEAAQRDINHRVKTYLDSCALANSLYPANCPFAYTFFGRVQDNVTWSISEYPEVKATINEKGQWSVADAKGKAKISFTQVDLLTGATSKVTQEVAFTVRTRVSVTGDELSVTVSP